MAEMGDKGAEGISPWLRIWFEPKETIRSIVNTNVKRGFFLLSAIYGFPFLLNQIQALAFSSVIPLWALLVGAVILCPFVGMVGIYLGSWLFQLAGKWIGGKANFLEIRAAVAWSSVPSLITIAMWVVLLVFFGEHVFDREFVQTQFIGYEAGIVFVVMLAQMMASIWGFILLLNTLAEVQGFSVWKALLNVLIPFVGVIILIWFFVWALFGS